MTIKSIFELMFRFFFFSVFSGISKKHTHILSSCCYCCRQENKGDFFMSCYHHFKRQTFSNQLVFPNTPIDCSLVRSNDNFTCFQESECPSIDISPHHHKKREILFVSLSERGSYKKTRQCDNNLLIINRFLLIH